MDIIFRNLLRYKNPVLAVILLTTALSAWVASQLEIRSSLKELLPQNTRSVVALNEAIENIGGVGTLMIAVEGPDFEANRQFASALVKRLSKHQRKFFRSIQFETSEIENFFKNNALLYLDIKTLRDLHERAQKRLEYEHARVNPLFLSLDEKAPMDFDIHDYEDRLRRSAPDSGVSTFKSYLGGHDGKLLLIILRSQGTNLSLDFSRHFVSTVKEEIEALSPPRFHPDMSVGLSGTIPRSLEEFQVVQNDILSTGFLCTVLVILVLFLFLREIYALLLLGIALLAAICWTFAATFFVIGSLNAQTAFLGAIVAGTGINYSVILWGRFREYFVDGESLETSLLKAMKESTVPTILAASTTASAFAVLAVSGIRSLSQFAFIGSVGVLLCWLSTYTLLPILILQVKPKPKSVRGSDMSTPVKILAMIPNRLCMPVALTILLIFSASVYGIYDRWGDAIEYDFNKLQNRSSTSTGTEHWDRKVGKLLKGSTVPTVIHFDHAQDTKAYCHALRKMVRAKSEKDQKVGKCSTVFDFIPDRQKEKLQIIAQLRTLLHQSWISKLSQEVQNKAAEARKHLPEREIALEDLPRPLIQNFQDIQGRIGTIAFISPKTGVSLSDGHSLLAFADTLNHVVLSNGKHAYAAGDSLIFSDIVAIIRNETPKLILTSFLLVFLVTALLIRRVRAVFAISASLFAGVFWMLGLAGLFQMRINFFNFMVIPLTIGVAADYGLNMGIRLFKGSGEPIERVFQNTGKSVALCSATTLVSFYVLTYAKNQALGTFGKAAILGELTCLGSALVFLPLLHRVLTRHANREGARS